jgi:peptide/nickel transport system substrate-binding protein
MKTYAGSNFMDVFNSWYYSFSPYVAQYENSHATARALVKLALYPLLDILHLASSTYSLAASRPELAALMTGLVASTLIGLVYLALPMLAILWVKRDKIHPKTKVKAARWIAATLAALITGFTVSEIIALPVLMMFASTGLVLTALGAASVLPALALVQHLNKKA